MLKGDHSCRYDTKQARITETPRISETERFRKDNTSRQEGFCYALGEIGDPTTLPTLQDILKSRTFFRRHAAMNLKLEIIDSLKKYPVGDVSPILRELASSGPQPLVNHARTVMKDMKVGLP